MSFHTGLDVARPLREWLLVHVTSMLHGLVPEGSAGQRGRTLCGHPLLT